VSIVTAQGPVPLQAPLQPAKAKPGDGDAASGTRRPTGLLKAQVAWQWSEIDALVTRPLPMTLMFKGTSDCAEAREAATPANATRQTRKRRAARKTAIMFASPAARPRWQCGTAVTGSSVPLFYGVKKLAITFCAAFIVTVQSPLTP
jgi:hypothetical protein